MLLSPPVVPDWLRHIPDLHFPGTDKSAHFLRWPARPDKNESFYETNQEKIIFAISVHELECWLLSICKDLKAEKITSCFEALQRECKDIKVEKNYSTYDKISKVFLKNKELLKISSKNSSFDIFIKSLPEDI